MATFESLLRVAGHQGEASLKGSSFVWKDNRKIRTDRNIVLSVKEVIAVKQGQVEITSNKKISVNSGNFFTVFYVKRVKQQKWTVARVLFAAETFELSCYWTRLLQEHMQYYGETRPEKLLVFINPFGGRRQGKNIYNSQIASLFELAGVSTTVVETAKANHARDYLLEEDLQGYDGVICVGGDGMFSELMHGLIGRAQKDAGIPENDPDAEYVSPTLRIGIIPAGSTDCICFATVGVNDPVTSALHIIIGDTQPLDVCGVYREEQLLKYSVSLVGYGFYADVLSDSDKHRWMGPVRYDYAGVKMVLSNRSYEGTVQFQLAEDSATSPRDNTRCRAGCLVCSDSTEVLPIEGELESQLWDSTETINGWKSVTGSFVAINLTCMSSACPKSPDGLSPCAHLADGTADLIMVRKCSRFHFLRHLSRHTNKKDQFDLPFVEVHRVKALRFIPLDHEETNSKSVSKQKNFFKRICKGSQTQSAWNCDGELLPYSTIDVKVHRQLIKLFARGIEEHSPSPTNSSCCF
ncbi:ceramide kinase-like [Protopterus annectens]|uniref:ceramide kinase-like n=1 Tax=Protopterus annectens TaxID=7888 RepID=UPI001CFB9753|nr:ceramide kinase-like [Protopterus annectens]